MSKSPPAKKNLKTIQIFAKLLFYEYQNIQKGILILKIYQREESALKKYLKCQKQNIWRIRFCEKSSRNQ